ncbi:restriction endonuclease subunit S [Escherichia coli]|uniref:restriction endonuclease subunit S n=1 Tax=Escherichia coli TaxID=562 RepID=UPI000B7FCDD5|nr:restriction endonuclease subunit S [Escherichia coli]MED9720552.1 restriction endonuclease subunit S [Escherichia marmotae]
MSELSYLGKLLDGVEVEWLPLGHIAAIKTGQSVNKNMISKNPGVYPVINSGREPLGFINTWNTDNDPIGITTRGAGVGSVIWQEGKYFRGNLNYSITIDKKNHINIRYMYHALLHMKNDIHELCTFDGIPALNAGSLKKLLIPIPCPDNPAKSLAIQSEIVRILDKFSELTAELTAELTMRKKQYNYYRNQLLSFKEGEVEWKTLGDVTKKWYSGGTPTAGKIEYYANGNIPWLRTQEVKFSEIDSTEIKITQAALKNSSAKWIPRNCVIIAISGATAGRSAINKIPLTTNQHCGCLEIDDTKALYRYVFHWVSFNYENIKSLGQGARGDLNSTIIKNFKLPIPHASDPKKSLKEQARIVEILDKFDTLTNSITEGLPSEIELRQKQYEYYRDLLFSFPKPETVSN